MRSPFIALCFLVPLAAAPSLYAANPCLTGGFPQPRDGTGTGGTGYGPLQEDGSGVGGTGHAPRLSDSTDGNGMGGTGHGPLQEGGTGTGGTGHAPWKEAADGHGMGGTGNTPTQGDGGIGGTGHDTEVEGVITGFASVCVNGLELHYQPSTPISINGRAATPKDLAVGQVVRALTKGTGDQLAITRLQIRHLMVASLQDISDGHAKAMGLTIVLDEGARLPPGLEKGQKVAISGFVGPGGTIIVTRLDAVAADSPDSVTGEVSKNGRGDRTIGGVTVDMDDPNLNMGETVRAEGRYANGRFRADHIERDDAPRTGRFVIQGPVKESGGDRLNVGGKRFAVDPTSSVKHELPSAGAWVRIEGHRRGRELLIEKIDLQGRSLPNLSDSQERARKDGKRAEHNSGSGRERSEREDREDREDREEKVEREDREEKVEREDREEKVEREDREEKVEREDREEKVEREDREERVEREDREEREERQERPEREEAHERD